MSNPYMDKLFEGVPDPDDECYQINFPIKEKRDFDPTPTNLRAHFLHRASPLIDEYIDSALGRKVLNSTSDHARIEVWNILKQIILEAKNPSPLMNIRGKPINDQVDQILTLTSSGKINLEEGKEWLSLIQQGFEVTEIPKMMEKLETLEALGIIK